MDKTRFFQKFDLIISDYSLLEQAFWHNSAVHEENLDPLKGNERLEFLGDAVLEYAVSLWAYEKYPDYSEGQLTALRSLIVCEKTLSSWALENDLGALLVLGKGEEKDGGRQKPAILADSLEALIGAISLEFGLKKAQEFVCRYILDNLDDDILNKGYSQSWKNELQELVQQKFSSNLPKYTSQKEGPDHAPFFKASVLVDGRVLGQGQGKSKKEAEQEAAKLAYKKLQDEI